MRDDAKWRRKIPSGKAGRAMTITFSMAPDTSFERGEPGREPSAHLGAEVLQPMLAGARARGMSDALEMLGLAFVMIDAHGMILHVSAEARAFMGPWLAVASEHLVGAGQGETRAIQSLIGSVLHEGASPGRMSLSRGQGMRPLLLRGLPVPSPAHDPCQLLKALVILEESPEG